MAHDLAMTQDDRSDARVHRRLDDQQLQLLRMAPITPRMPNRVKLAMTLLGVRLQDVIKGSGISPATISSMLNTHHAARHYSFPIVQTLAEYFGCTSDDLFPKPPGD
jgi:hypothetical protein